MDKKGKKGNLVSVILTILVIAIYLVPNFASAVSVKVMTDKLQYLPVDTQIVADVSIKINANERIPIKNLVLLANEEQVCVFNVDGSYLKENCPDAISITPISSGIYGQGTLQGTDESNGTLYQFGYGYGYGYGMDYGYTGNLSYHLIFNKSNTPPGIYKLKLSVNSISHIFSGEADFEIVGIDSDGDDVADAADNCPSVANANQADADSDGAGDVCDCSINDASVRPPKDGEHIISNTALCPGTYNLPNGILITADNIILDCNGADLNGGGNGYSGVYLVAVNNVEVKNCVVHGYLYGVYVGNTFNISVLNNTLENKIDILIKDSSFNNIIGNNISEKYYYTNHFGIWMDQSNNNLISNNNIEKHTGGIYLTSYSTGNTINSNRVCSNIEYGISDADSNSGDENTCDTTENWNDTGTTGCTYACVDTDGDGILDAKDNCPFVSNTDQADSNGNGIGDVCEIIACSTNAQCGTNIWTGSAVCSGNNVYQNYITYTCNIPGTVSSSCTSSTTNTLKENCNDGNANTEDSCSNGVCSHQTIIACSTNSDCNDNNPLTIDTCNNPGTQSSSCSHQGIACSTNANCGASGYTGATTCSGNNVAQNYITYTCNNAGTPSSLCSSSTSNQLKQACYDANDYTADLCSNGNCYYPAIICSTNANCNDNNAKTQDLCINAGTTSAYCSNLAIKCLNDAECNDNNAYTKDTCLNAGTSTSSCSYQTIRCLTNADCGTNGYITNNYCNPANNDVYKDYKTYTCNNPGIIQSSCSDSTTAKLIEDCVDGCENGACIANTKPVITSTPITEAMENTKYEYKVIAADKEQTKLSFTDDSPLFNINSLNGLISFTPTKANLGAHIIKITVSDGWLKDTQTFTLTISSVNNPPILASIGALSAKEDELFTKTVSATDKDNDALTYSDDTSLFDISSAGLISFTPTKANIGAHTITISVSDGKKTASETLTLTVLAKETVNTAPVITSYTPIESPTITELQQQTFTIQATDKESVPGIIWYEDNIIVGSGNSYTFIGDNSMENSNAGVHAIKAIASDGELKAEHSWILTVTRVKDTDSDGIPDATDNCVFVANANQLDSDSNGIGDACQGNIDGDAVPDEEDFVEGTADNVDSNMQLNLDIGEENDTEKENIVTRVITGTQPVTFKTTEVDPVTQEVVTKPVVKFDFNFAEETKLDLSKIEITKQEETATAGEIIVKGIDLTAQGKTKTVYMDRKAGTDTICIKDAEIASIKEISAGCTGASEYLIACNSQKQGSYTCTIEGNKYKVEGLTHSGLIESLPNNAPSAVITTSSQSVSPYVPLQLAGYGTDPDNDNIVEYSWDLSSYDNHAQKIMFVTKNTYDGNLQGLAGADNICQEEADAANLLGTYKAWLSDSTTNAKDRLNIYNNYRLVDGTVIKENEALTYSPPGYIGGSPYELINNPINKDAYGNNINDYVWTATTHNGNIATTQYTCRDWTSSSNSDVSQVGLTNKKTNGWTEWMGKNCNEKFHLYCVQQTDINNGIIKQQSPSISLTKPGTYSFKFIVKDERNAVGESTVQIRVLEKQNIALKQGWNLISLPLKPTDTSITSVLSSIQGKYDQVWAYQNGLWKVYDTARPVFLNTLNNIDESMGLYVKATQDTTLNVIGTTPSSTLISLKKGQNLIGYPSSVSRAAGDVLTTNYNSLLTLENGLWLVYDPARPPFLNTLTTIQPGKGYWVVVDNDAVWTFENGLYK